MTQSIELTPEEKIAEQFYAAFQKLDGSKMAEFYDESAHFTDPVFRDLRGEDIGMMWRMLTTQAKDFELQYSNIRTEKGSVRVHWEAKYTFTKTGRKIHNIIEAEMMIREGKIFLHRDRFDLWRWFRMAMGVTGYLIGWMPFSQKALRDTAARNLRLFKIEEKKKSKQK